MSTPTRPAVVHLLAEVSLAHPFWLHLEAHRGRPFPFLLDSANPIKGLGRHSFLGSTPIAVFRARRSAALGDQADIEVSEWLADDGTRLDAPRVTHTTGDPFAALRALLHRWRVEVEEWQGRRNAEPSTPHPVSAAHSPTSPTRGEVGLVGSSPSANEPATPTSPLVGEVAERSGATPAGGGVSTPFLGGAVGYFAYEARHYVEPLPADSVDRLGMPDVYFALYDTLLAHHHETNTTYLSVVGRGRDADEAKRRAERTRDEWLADVKAFAPAPLADGPTRPPIVSTTADGPTYARQVQACKDHIFAGDAFEVCLTRRLWAPFRGDPWRLYLELRQRSPAPFACYLDYPEGQVVSSSPERFVKLDSDRVAECRPIKGTRPRGATPEEDDGLRRELLTSEKDRAENMMIVDLVRNDLGRVCAPGTVSVPELMAIEPYTTVFQMVSTVRGRLRDGLDGLDMVKACFPGGSMTGAPKIEAMKIMDRLEGVQRGIYSGSVGYLDYSGRLDLNIVIRTLVVANGVAHFSAGGAVVADSDPVGEYEETVTKVRAIVAALGAVPLPEPTP